MRNVEKSKKIGISIFSILFLIVLILSFVTYKPAHFVFQNTLLAFAVTNHAWVMVIMILVAVLFGFFWSQMLYRQIETKQKNSMSVMDIVFTFLSKDERNIIDFLVEKEGKTTQAEISRLSKMNKVKAFRCLKKMQEKNIIDIKPHGKIRYIQLKKNIFDVLKEE